jgi:long-chain acyl-CoA synthetase
VGKVTEPVGFWALAASDPAHVAVVTPSGEEIAAGDLLARCNRVAHGLRDLGLHPGDAVAFVLPNGPELLVLSLACMQSGLYLVPINTHLVGTEIAYIVSNSEARVFVGHERFEVQSRQAMAEADVQEACRFSVSDVEGFRPFEELSAGRPDTLPPDRTLGMVMNYTSGTTGKPKGVRRPLPGLLPEVGGPRLSGQAASFGLLPQDDNVHLVGSPLYHTAPLMWASGALQAGHTVVVMDKWNPEEMLRLIEKHRVTYSHMVPTQFHRLLALPDDVKQRYDLSSMRHMIHAAAPCPVETKRRMIEWWGPVIDEYYGSTEGGGTTVFAHEWLKKPGTVGQPWPITELGIFDDDGHRHLEPGTVGTVYFKMEGVSFEYYKDEEKTAKSRIGDFFTVGDMGYLDEDGWLFLTDRKADMIISGGANIYPAEIEGVLLTHPKVRDAAVFGVPNPEWGEEVKAVVEVAPGVHPGQALTDELLAFSAGKLAKFKLPKSIDFVDALPRDPNGKLYKRRLRDPYWEGVAL